MSVGEKRLACSAAAISVILKLVALFRYRFDADEQQHLHVAWGWTAGLVQYRDYFDNHAPLFHLLTAPLLALAGERSDILLWMRLPMLLLCGVVLWATYLVGRQLYDARTAVWAVILLSLFPPFFLKSLEYRTDNLWTALVMLAAAALVGRRRPLVAGLLLGAAVATSLKTLSLLAAIFLAAFLTHLLVRRQRASSALELLAGVAAVPAVLALFFVQAGAWDPLIYCNVTFNGLTATMRDHLWLGRAVFPLLLAALVFIAWRFRGADPWRFSFAVAAAANGLIVFCFWTLISPRDFLAVMPVAAIFAAAALTRTSLRVMAAVIALTIAGVWHYADRFENQTDWHVTMMDQVLRLTRPGDRIIDLKGETIYRRRPFYYVFEMVGRTAIAKGLIADTLPEDVVRTRTYVAQADGPMWSPRARAFLSDHFVNVGRLRVAGQWIGEDGAFTIAVPGPYVVLSDRGAVTRPRHYAAGRYRARLSGGERLAVVWAPAVERGHSPFHLRDTEF